ncbi:hypothetical protein E2C01_074993 [Portunus trituberculatus]|uniref:Uncharacterized protein n=1 Tax=Portunus trituberculatus TaxID=210409 RepID=A0A5B7IIQ1_PORTR|nr:hypothetical protein [Portunus trituberculatus]
MEYEENQDEEEEQPGGEKFSTSLTSLTFKPTYNFCTSFPPARHHGHRKGCRQPVGIRGFGHTRVLAGMQ